MDTDKFKLIRKVSAPIPDTKQFGFMRTPSINSNNNPELISKHSIKSCP